MQALRRVYGGLRRRLGPGRRSFDISADQPCSFCMDVVWRVAPDAYYVKGWVWDPEGRVTSLLARTPEGAAIDILQCLHRYERPDVAEFFRGPTGVDPLRSGLVGLVTVSSPIRSRAGWRLQMVTGDGAQLESAVDVSDGDPFRLRQTIVADLGLITPVSDRLLREHVHPAVTRLAASLPAHAEVTKVVTYGAAAERPPVSVVIPLYRRIDFLAHQLASFANDPAIREADLVYVLDSPELAESLFASAPLLYELYRVPFRLAVLSRNYGYALANNAGAELARAPLLLLLNSDVIPERPGWLQRMVSAHRSTPSPGALGPKLLYEDGSIQHAGLYFRRLPDPPEWSNEHFFKGYHRQFGPACVDRPVPAVTGACFLVDRALFRALGGLRDSFLQGDYEDSDLCLRLIESGRQNWYLSEVELFHLEAQSHSGSARVPTTRYNRWLQTRLWDERIAELMQRVWTVS